VIEAAPLAAESKVTPAVAPAPQAAIAEAAAPARKSAKTATRIGDKSGKTRPAEPMIPLVHAPDDPGPDQPLDADPVPEPTAPSRDPWQRFIGLFR
jgi:HemY protein